MAKTNRKRIMPARAIAEVLGMDVAEMPDYRYQPTRTKQAIYAIGDNYFAANKQPSDWMGKPWLPCGVFDGVQVWKSPMITGAKNG